MSDAGEPDQPDSEALLARIAALEGSLASVTKVLGRCVVATAAASVTALTIGREMQSVVEASGTTPTWAPLLRTLEEQVGALRRAVEEAGVAG